MSEMSFDQAAEALSAAAVQDATYVAPTTPAPAASTPTDHSEVDGGATMQDSFTGVDPNSLPPELQQYYRSMQAVYTRKTQALAEQRKMFEGVDPERALQSVQFIDALDSDPDFALQVYNELNGVLSQAGLLQAMEAAGVVTPPQTPSPREPWEADDDSDSPLAEEVEET